MSRHIDPRSATSSGSTKPPRLGAVLRVFQKVPGVLRTRAFRRFLLATPILLVGLCVPLAMPALRGDPSEIRARYERLASRAQKQEDTKTVSVCLDRLTRLKNESDITDPEFTLRLSAMARELGQIERAEVLLDEVAPEDRAVHAPAHYARAVTLLTGSKTPTLEDRVRAERHLRYALSLKPDFAPAHQLLGMILLQSGDWAGAEKHLAQAAKSNPALSYHVAVVLYNQNQKEVADAWARKARDFFRQSLKENPDNHGARLLLASSELLLEEYEAGQTTLRQGLARQNLTEFHQLLANAYLAEAVALRRRDESNLAGRLTLLEQGLQHDPTNVRLIAQLWEVMQAGGPEAEQLRTRLRTMLTEGKALATAHLILGYDAWTAGRPDEARLHWERALEAAPASAMVANNLAWILASQSEPDLPRALELIDLALDGTPNDPNFLSTRGRILARLKRWKEALSSLEAALPALPNNQSLHADLADVYTALGSTKLAEEHRRLAETPPKNPPPANR